MAKFEFLGATNKDAFSFLNKQKHVLVIEQSKSCDVYKTLNPSAQPFAMISLILLITVGKSGTNASLSGA